MPYNVDIRYVPGPKMEFAVHGSRYPISYGQHKCFESEPGELGIYVRSRRVQSVDFRDPKVEILAGIAAQDDIYQKNVEHTENQNGPELIHKSSELRQLMSSWGELSAVSLDSGKLIIRNGTEILIPKASRAGTSSSGLE